MVSSSTLMFAPTQVGNSSRVLAVRSWSGTCSMPRVSRAPSVSAVLLMKEGSLGVGKQGTSGLYAR